MGVCESLIVIAMLVFGLLFFIETLRG